VEIHTHLDELVDATIQLYLSGDDHFQQGDWWFNRAARGVNGQVYRIRYTGDEPDLIEYRDLAVKITRYDVRDRITREHTAFTILHETGHTICPQPYLLEHEIPDLSGASLLVSSWLPGRRLEVPPSPQDKRTWRDILYALSAAHHVNPKQVDTHVDIAMMPALTPHDLFTVIESRHSALPPGDIGGLSITQLDRLIEAVVGLVRQQWQAPVQVGLIQCDPDPTNMIAHDSTIRLVDWEYSGWADPAYEIGDLCAQPMYFDLPDDHRAWIRTEYGRIMEDNTAATRAGIYEVLMNAFWVFSLSQRLANAERSEQYRPDRPAQDYMTGMQMRYWERTQVMLGVTL
jgi:hypothetical protein